MHDGGKKENKKIIILKFFLGGEFGRAWDWDRTSYLCARICPGQTDEDSFPSVAKIPFLRAKKKKKGVEKKKKKKEIPVVYKRRVGGRWDGYPAVFSKDMPERENVFLLSLWHFRL